ncbi:MAG: ABC transporter permease subunit [Firmicutes bacterium]|nr:ABC transporter permease subunit [Bacillota bacterium]
MLNFKKAISVLICIGTIACATAVGAVAEGKFYINEDFNGMSEMQKAGWVSVGNEDSLSANGTLQIRANGVSTIQGVKYNIALPQQYVCQFNVLSTNGGIVNEIIKFFGGEPKYFLGEPKYFVNVLVIASIWQGVGWGSIVYLAAITGIDTSLYEAAKVDGATKWQQMWYITLPCIAGVACTMLILNLGHILDAGFDQILLLYSPSVYKVADIIDTYVYREGLGNMNYSYSAAVGLFKSVVGCIMVVTVNFIAKALGQEGIW